MKTATKGDKPDWFAKPADVVGVNVCRVSGKLPNYGCATVQALDDEGFLVTKSQVYTDYFVKGTQPSTICPLHPGGILADAATLALPGAVATTGIAPPPPPPAGAPPLTGGTVQPRRPAREARAGQEGLLAPRLRRQGRRIGVIDSAQDALPRDHGTPAVAGAAGARHRARHAAAQPDLRRS